MCIYKKIICLVIIPTFLSQMVCNADAKYSCFAPTSNLPVKSSTDDKYLLILKRFVNSSRGLTGIPDYKFVEFVQSAEQLFKGYRSYSRFPFNPQVAVQFVKNNRFLIRQVQRLFVESLGHLKKREVCNRRTGMARVEEIVKSKLTISDYAVVDLMGRPGVGKSTIAGKIKKGFASLQADEVLVIPVDGFRHNDVGLVNELIRNRGILNKPLKDLSREEYAFFERAARSLQIPLVRDSDKSFLDFYLVAEEREEETGENKRRFRRQKLWNHIGTNPRLQRCLNIPLRSLSIEDYNEVIRIAKEMRLDAGAKGNMPFRIQAQ